MCIKDMTLTLAVLRLHDARDQADKICRKWLDWQADDSLADAAFGRLHQVDRWIRYVESGRKFPSVMD